MMSQPTRVCIVGHVCIDENSDTSEVSLAEAAIADPFAFGTAGTRVADSAAPRSAVRTPGSPAVFMAREFDALGREVESPTRTASSARTVTTSILATHGSDFTELSPSTPVITPTTPWPSLLYRNFVVDGRRRQQCRNACHARPPVLDRPAIDALRSADIVIVAPLLDDFSPDYLDALFTHIAPGALRVLLPQGYFRSIGAGFSIHQAAFTAHERVLPLFDLVVFSDEDCADALDRAAEWSGSTPARIVVTHGERGATAFEHGTGRHVPAAPIPPVDFMATIGAGDVFSAHLAVSYRASHDLLAAIEVAHVAAAGFLVDGATREATAALLAG